MSFNVLKIKFKSPKTTKLVNEVNGHLALRLNDAKVVKSEEVFEIIEYIRTIFGVKYLTLICGKFGFEREIDFWNNEKNNLKFVSFYNNHELAYTDSRSTISVNLIDNDSESVFLLKIKENLIKSDEDIYESIYKAAINSFNSNLMELKLKLLFLISCYNFSRFPSY